MISHQGQRNKDMAILHRGCNTKSLLIQIHVVQYNTSMKYSTEPVPKFRYLDIRRPHQTQSGGAKIQHFRAASIVSQPYGCVSVPLNRDLFHFFLSPGAAA